ncbi:MAG: helix-turn-helix transcriptional regulator [Deltaproteobacteria bacterium]|nr:helix-turn-helix transcriptional regulator [Deltaproteobacteria bacterium]
MIKVVLNRNCLEKAVTRRNLSRKGLAHELGVSRCYLSRVIWGKAEPSAAIRQRLLDYFKDCTFDDLFTIEEDGHDGNGQR